jgi:hypothetical protein
VDKICLHPQAQDLLFEYYRALRLIFNDVLGHLELDYLSFALINPEQELLFLSSQPSIEQNLIEQNLWLQDPCLNHLTSAADCNLIWNEIYQKPGLELLKHFKLIKPRLEFVFSRRVMIQDYGITYSFGVKSYDPMVQFNLIQNVDTLLSMGKFCLQNILKEIHLELPPALLKKSNQHLNLVINNF